MHAYISSVIILTMHTQFHLALHVALEYIKGALATLHFMMSPAVISLEILHKTVLLRLYQDIELQDVPFNMR